MKKIIFLLLLATIHAGAVELSRPIGYDKIKTGMSFQSLQKIIKSDYPDWAITYIDVNPETDLSNPNIEVAAPDAYYTLNNNTGVQIIIELTEGVSGEVSGVSVRESFKTTDLLYTQYYLLKYILTQKYGNPSESNGPDTGQGFDYDVYTKWEDDNQSVTILGSYCSVLDDKGKEVSCHSVKVNYLNDTLNAKRNNWIESRRKTMKKLKYKNDYSKY